MNYVVGFYFSRNNNEVLLIRKNRPQWQAGKLNGIGGKIENCESAYDAMCREFMEETGLWETEWYPLCVLTGDWGTVEFFYTWGTPQYAESRTDEQVEIHQCEFLPSDVIPNLKWLIPMAIHDRKQLYHIVEFNG
jgi:8-oxo-dGTP diphosphatase